MISYDDIGGFIAQVVLGPRTLGTESGPFNPRTYVLFFPSELGRWITLAGIGGLGVTLRDADRTGAWPLALGGALVTGIIVFIGFDGLWDMVFPLVFTALGVGIAVSRLPRRVGIATVVTLALLLVPTFAPSDLIRQEPVEMEPSDGLPPALDPEREHVYWTHQSVDSCRFFGAGTQRSVLEYYPDAETLAEAPCGDVGLYWSVTRKHLQSP
jgi:hypothetical protein